MTIPNMISAVRILLIPFFVHAFVTAVRPEDFLLAALILVVSGISDILDGFIARRFHMTSRLGKVIDPAADKLTLFAVVASLWLKYPKFWMMYTLFLAKELFMAVGGLFILHRNHDIEGARWFGKLYTIIFYVVSVIVIVDSRPEARIRPLALSFMCLFTIFCFAMYIPVFVEQLHPASRTESGSKPGALL